MKPGYRLELVQAQKLVLTPELCQAILMLQMNIQELTEFVLAETEGNPLLEVSDERVDEISTDAQENEEEDWISYFCDSSDLGIGQSVSRQERNQSTPAYQGLPEICPTIREHLLSQLRFLHLDPQELIIADFIIGSIDGNGYLECPLLEIAVSTSSTKFQVESVLKKIQGFDPPGVAARDLRECLELQAIHRNLNSLSLAIIRYYLDDLANARYSKIAQKEQVPLKSVLRARDAILKLDPKPGAIFSLGSVTFIIPDVSIRKFNDDFIVVLNDNALPSIRWNSFYRRLLANGEHEAKNYLTQQARKAYFLLKSIEQRKMTISRVMECILKHQKRFFVEGPVHIEPMTLSDIANELNIHSSTVSRAVSGKYVDTPFGVFPCRMFFSPKVAAKGKEVSQYNIKKTIEDIVENEDPMNPLTDGEIGEILAKKGLTVARRTVAKYRSQLGILPSNRRKRL